MKHELKLPLSETFYWNSSSSLVKRFFSWKLAPRQTVREPRLWVIRRQAQTADVADTTYFTCQNRFLYRSVMIRSNSPRSWSIWCLLCNDNWLPDIWPQRSPGSSYFLHQRSIAQSLPLMSRNLGTCNDTTCILKRYGVGTFFHQIMYNLLSNLVCSQHIFLDDMMWPQPKQHGETTTLSLIEIFDLTRDNTHIYTDTHSGSRTTTSHQKVTRKQTGHPGATLGWFRVLACEPFKSLVLDVYMDAFPQAEKEATLPRWWAATCKAKLLAWESLSRIYSVWCVREDKSAGPTRVNLCWINKKKRHACRGFVVVFPAFPSSYPKLAQVAIPASLEFWLNQASY